MEAFFFALLALFSLAEVFIAVRYSKAKKSSSLKHAVAPAVLFLFYLLVLCIIRIRVPYFVLTLAMLTVFLHTFVGLYLDLYHRSKTFDRYLHGFGSFSFALLLYLTLSKVTSPGGSVLFRSVFVAVMGIAAGAVFEALEFLHDSRNKMKMQRGLKDTDFDLIFDVIGSVAAAILAAFTYL